MPQLTCGVWTRSEDADHVGFSVAAKGNFVGLLHHSYAAQGNVIEDIGMCLQMAYASPALMSNKQLVP